MAYDVPQPGSLKRKRRRREDKPAISAKLYLDSSLKGEVGVLSSDLEEDLFPSAGSTKGDGKEKLYHAAFTPWTPNPSPTESSWSVLPVRGQAQNEKPLPASTIRFPATAHGTQSFVRIVQALYPTKTLRQNSTVEVRISDVVPLPLDTIFVSVDTEALQKLEDVNKRYGSGFSTTPAQSARKAGKRALASPTEETPGVDADGKSKALVSEALRHVQIVHAEDVLPLSLVHPVTHTPAPPAKVLSCEPVSQGVVVATTNIVIVPASDKRTNLFNNKALLSPRLDEDSGEEDTANEQFFSATEENSPAKPIVVSKSATDMSNSEDLFDSSAEESNLSDDSDDMISLAKPGLADAPSGLSSALTSATPRPFGAHTRGISTPGSVFSNLTSTTIRGGHSVRSKVFRAQGLIERIPNELLHPKPASDEDEEARVYVDATALTRLGCFSGDWVKIETAESPLLPSFSAFGALDDVHSRQSRPVKVYTLPESMSKRPQRYQVNNGRYGRRDSISSLVTNSSAAATIYLSPVLLVNLGEPSNINMMSIPSVKKTSLKRPITPRPTSVSARLPPTASEVTLRKIVTPISTERTLINTLYANLKQYFEEKQRVVKPGDVIAIPVDESLGRSIYEGDVEQDGSSTGAILSQIGPHREQQTVRSARNVAWFAIEDVSVPPSEDSNEVDADIWGNVASIDPSRMTMRQSGDERRKLPSVTSNTWQYYLGVRNVQAKTTSGSGPPEASQPYVSPLQRRLRELISVSISPRAVHLGMPPLTVLITSTQRNIGKASTVQRACADIGIHYFPIDAHDIVSEGGVGVDTHAQGLLEARCERALECGPEHTAICITHLEAISADRAAASLKEVLETCRVLVATTTDIDKVPDSVRGYFTHELEMSAPDEGEREGILRDAITESGIPLAAEVDLGSIAVKTAALVAGDLVDVVDRAFVAKAERLESLARSKSEAAHELVTMKDIQISGGASATSVTPADFDAAVDLARKNFADSIGAPKIPNVQWSDVGGLTNVKDAVIETIQLPLSRPELFAKGLKKRSGILFYGPPGTGKTLLAKAIATEFSLNFFSVKGPELLNMYIGESEANVRRVFQRARDARPCVVFFDELDSVAPKRGNQGDSGGVMDRIVSQLLAELDGMSDGDENGGGVFVIGATNRPDLLDQALLRPGRFDKMLYLSISDTHAKQAAILEALTRKFTLDPSVSLARVAETLPFTFTGADLYALCSDAMLKAVTRSARQVDARVQHINGERASRGQAQISVAYYFDHYDSEDDTQVMVTEEDFIRAKEDLVPSVSVDELRHYERVRASFEGATKKPETGEAQPMSSSNGSDRNGQGVARSGVMQGVNHASMGKATTMNGNARSHGVPTSIGHSGTDEDDFVIRTDQLSLINHTSGRSPSGKGKGKGKSHDVPNAIDAVASNQLSPGPVNGETGEDLYD
ncbi:Peroxisomal biogenesis factor 6 [Pseudocercospora fuligena]|uniref:Peroxisomal ATPase PEX6 n=1 Tax=Pseudocercospora fuligena TaxID=685502 RepID=A0A8H6VL38_9PEZI|nr:Peroxisomal biogenesis factor 6 [Pseudocercospora fuligena]